MARPKSIAASDADGAPPRTRTLIRIPKTAELVAATIRKMIIRGEVKEGDFLQPEAQLIEHFGTSRPTIREAFRILENEQLISVTRGSRSGARVHAPNVSNVARYAGFALQAQGTLLADVYLARLAIEPFAVRLLAERPDKGFLEPLSAELDALGELFEEERGAEAFRGAVFRLHDSMVAAAGSNTLTMISAMLQGIVEQHMARFHGRKEEISPKRRRATLGSFRKLFDMIAASDAEGAEAHWRVHVKNANETWLQGFDRTSLVDVLD